MAGLSPCHFTFKNMKVNIETEDQYSFTAEEVIRTYKNQFGDNTVVRTGPINSSPEEHMYYAIQNIMSIEQVEAFYTLYPHLYPQEIEKIKLKILKEVGIIFDRVVSDNEGKIK